MFPTRAGPLLARLFTLTLALSCLFPSITIAQTAKTLTLTFRNEVGEPIGIPQTIHLTTCTPLDTVFLESTGGLYSSVTASDPQAALNLYSADYCSVLTSSAVGQWNNVAPVQNMVGVRWEGAAPSSLPPGTLRPDPFPPGLAVQTKVPNPDELWVMNPAKGRVVVGVIAGVLVIGVALGIYEVYKAATYVSTSKPYNPIPVGSVGAKKIKKEGAYYRKPVNRDGLLTKGDAVSSDSTFRRVDRDSRSPLLAQQRDSIVSVPVMHEHTKDSRLSVGTFTSGTVVPGHFSGVDVGAETGAGIGAGAGFMDRNNRTNNIGSGYPRSRAESSPEAVLIDMHDTAAVRRPWAQSHSSNSSANGGGSNYPPSSSTTLVDSNQFSANNSSHSVYHPPPPSSQGSSSYLRGHGQAPGQGGRGSEVFVPMQQLEPRQSPSRYSDRMR
ncbi:hypothetical protein BG011_007060 [Mortierella polycephala]|uniref:Uncharacterized protein n=1 Tax=Mortierella polycephala TaxID=41804 RepID=A0A9P6QEQ9_9FUNG|nr:hypothetical protein BG011_007060 [Mortierella polycephala]